VNLSFTNFLGYEKLLLHKRYVNKVMKWRRSNVGERMRELAAHMIVVSKPEGNRTRGGQSIIVRIF